MADKTLDQFTAATAKPGIFSLLFARDPDIASPFSRRFTLRLLLELIQDGLTVKSMALTSPTALTPSKGDAYVVNPTGTGAWAGNDNAIAIYDGSAWQFSAPAEGWRVYDQNLNQISKYDGSAWGTIGASTIGYDNSTSGLTATTVQAALDEISGAFAALQTESGDSATLSTIGTTAKTLPFETAAISVGATANATTNAITVARAGYYKIDTNLDFSTVAAGDAGIYKVIVNKGGTPTAIEMAREMSGSSDTGSMASSGILLLAASDVITAEIESDDGGNSDDINIINASLIVSLLRAT